MTTQYIAMLDVESMGLYGKAFSYGIVIGDKQGNIFEEIYRYSPKDYEEAKEYAISSDIEWVNNNVHKAEKEYQYGTVTFHFQADWSALNKKYPGVLLFADVPFPVETNFITNTFKEWFNLEDSFVFSPYPLLCVTSFRRAHNLPDYFDRLPNELPVHHPLMDARQSYRGLVEVFNLMNK